MHASASENCPDCYSCVMSFPSEVTVFRNGPLPSYRIDGTMFVRADIGPGDAVKSMTYWDAPWDPNRFKVKGR